MKALVLYVLFVLIGGLISVGVGYYVEKEFSSTASLVVFLAMFFSNFAFWFFTCGDLFETGSFSNSVLISSRVF